MALPTRTTSHSVAVDIPEEDFFLILRQESIDSYHELDFPDLTAMLGGIDGVHDVEYNGHFGSAIYATFDLDDDGEKPQMDVFLASIETFIEDLRRVKRVAPGVLDYPRHRLEEYLQDDEQGHQRPRKIIYSHPDFIVTDHLDDDVISVLHLLNGKPSITDINAPAIRDALFADHDVRSLDRRNRKVVNVSRNMPGVDAVVRPHVQPRPRVDVGLRPSAKGSGAMQADFSSHFLFDDLPNDAVAVHAAARWLVADSGPTVGASITFRTEGEVGTKYFLSGAREQVLGLVRNNPAALDRWIEATRPEELDGPAEETTRAL